LLMEIDKVNRLHSLSKAMPPLNLGGLMAAQNMVQKGYANTNWCLKTLSNRVGVTDGRVAYARGTRCEKRFAFKISEPNNHIVSSGEEVTLQLAGKYLQIGSTGEIWLDSNKSRATKFVAIRAGGGESREAAILKKNGGAALKNTSINPATVIGTDSQVAFRAKDGRFIISTPTGALRAFNMPRPDVRATFKLGEMK